MVGERGPRVGVEVKGLVIEAEELQAVLRGFLRRLGHSLVLHKVERVHEISDLLLIEIRERAHLTQVRIETVLSHF